MAIQIINDSPDPRIVRGVRLRYVPLDVRRTTHTDYGGGSDDYYWIDCPKCKNANEVKR